MIELIDIYKRKENDVSFFCSKIKIDNKAQEIWFSTSLENEKHISESNADAFILFIFFYCVFENLEFKSNVPISKRLKFGLLEVLLPVFQEMGFKTTKEMFDLKLEDETKYPEASAIGTAMSFGVDSFFSYIKGRESINKINYLTLFNAGAFGQYGGEKALGLFEAMKLKVIDFASQNKLGFVWVNTNLNEVFKMPFVQTHTFRNFACVLVFQKLFKGYYYASGINIKNFKLNKLDPAYYDLINVKALAANSLELHISGLTENRIEKTRAISDNEVTFRNLNVCLITPDNKNLNSENKSPNCSKCFKCARTMVTLDILGKLDNFSNVFDLKVFNKNKFKYLAELKYKQYRSNDVLAKEIFNEAKTKGYNIPIKVYYYTVLRIFQPIIRKINNA